MTVIKDTCGQSFSFEINGQDPNFLGYGDMHDPAFDSYVRSARLERYLRQPESLCEHELFVYPSVTLQASYTSSKPVVYTVIVAMSFLLTFAMFVVYDVLVSRRQKKTMANALRTNAIVASLFPENVRDRLMEEAAAQVDRNARAKKNPDGLKSFLNENEIDSKINADDDDFFETKPIADLVS